ncbi:Imm26 family immunity protein [Burkholderia sp. 22PA0106]|uniref:Imm26 family immunity protein n=1 Tax=Burkholderia sp. 22PA0106 TaxID=3237371 RepID=UPI0039C2FC5E
MRAFAYCEGDVFLVPLRDGGRALGVVARANTKKGIVAGYFFKGFPDHVNDYSELGLTPSHATKILIFGDLSLRNGAWIVASHLKGWRAEDWPIPKFVREDPFTKRTYLISYAEDDPSVELSEEPFSGNPLDYPKAGLAGAGFVEKVLTEL